MLHNPKNLPCDSTNKNDRQRDVHLEKPAIAAPQLQSLPKYDSYRTHQKPQAVISAGSSNEHQELC